MSTASFIALPGDLRDLLIKLEFVSQIQQGSKVNIKTMRIVDSSSWFGSFQRSLSHENRRATTDFINNLVLDTIDVIKRYSDTIYISIVVSAFTRAKIGIEYLSDTYHDDPDTVSRFRVSLTHINLQLQRLER